MTEIPTMQCFQHNGMPTMYASVRTFVAVVVWMMAGAAFAQTRSVLPS